MSRRASPGYAAAAALLVGQRSHEGYSSSSRLAAAPNLQQRTCSLFMRRVLVRRGHDVRVAGISDPGYAFTIRLTTITDAGVDAPAGAASETGLERNDRSSERTSGLRCSRQESPR